jgi:hypothetical protein
VTIPEATLRALERAGDGAANVGLDLAAELAGQARSLAQGVVLACDGDIVAVEHLRQAL